MIKDNSTGKSMDFYDKGQTIFDRIPEEKRKMSKAEVDKALADQVKDWRAQFDRWLGNDGHTQKYKKQKGDL